MTREEKVNLLNELLEIEEKNDIGNLTSTDRREFQQWVEDLEQEPKTGHWIEHPEIETSTPEYLMFYECSECGDKRCFCKSDIHKKHFCNNCGAKMVEPQERSDKK